MWGSAGARPGVPGASLLAQSSLRPDRGRQSRWCGPPGHRPGGGSIYGGRRKPPRARGRREWPIVGLERDGSPWAPEKQSALWGRADPECVTCAPEPPSGVLGGGGVVPFWDPAQSSQRSARPCTGSLCFALLFGDGLHALAVTSQWLVLGLTRESRPLGCGVGAGGA